MPILDIEVVVGESEAVDLSWVQQIADAAGTVFGTEPGRTWVRLRRLQHSDYAENGMKSSSDLQPVFVSVLKSQLPPVDALRVESSELTLAISCILERPAENVHVLYLPPAAERQSFGGILVEEPS
jgi:phenylpyruvate tautomerase PptA (4-oxalocrotonate tautomerase family)